MRQRPDPRLTLARPDLAYLHLQGQVQADNFIAGTMYQITEPLVSLYLQPDRQQQLQTEILFGETFLVLEIQNEWAWGQAQSDGFVGYVSASALSRNVIQPDHWVSALRTPIYQWPDLKAPVSGFYHRNSRVQVTDRDDHYRKVGRGWVHAGDLKPLGSWNPDYVATALSYLHTPYVWGGRSSLGLDCSALVQNALYAAGTACLRDTDMQEPVLGEPVSYTGNASVFRRGDLVYWKGHVGIIADDGQLLHANALHMATAIEPVETALARIQKTAGPVTSVRRFLSA